MTDEQRRKLLKAQQGELDGVGTYLMLADTVHNEADKEVFKTLASDEGRHASVFKQYTGEILKPKKLQARAVVVLYHLIGKRALYPLIARFEYAAIPGYEQLEKEFPDVESVKNDEKRHFDNNKWFGTITDVPRDKLGLKGSERVDTLNVKIGDDMAMNPVIGKLNQMGVLAEIDQSAFAACCQSHASQKRGARKKYYFSLIGKFMGQYL